jgi:hypothetical protein
MPLTQDGYVEGAPHGTLAGLLQWKCRCVCCTAAGKDRTLDSRILPATPKSPALEAAPSPLEPE